MINYLQYIHKIYYISFLPPLPSLSLSPFLPLSRALSQSIIIRKHPAAVILFMVCSMLTTLAGARLCRHDNRLRWHVNRDRCHAIGFVSQSLHFLCQKKLQWATLRLSNRKNIQQLIDTTQKSYSHIRMLYVITLIRQKRYKDLVSAGTVFSLKLNRICLMEETVSSCFCLRIDVYFSQT